MNIKNSKPHLIKPNLNCGSKDLGLCNSKAIPFLNSLLTN